MSLPLREEFDAVLTQLGHHPLRSAGLQTFQMNIGKVCNMTCRHCHVDAGPDRRESMTRQTMEDCVKALAASSIPTVDLTGGAPELNPNFRWLVHQCSGLGRRVIDRCNLTVLHSPALQDLPRFLADHGVEMVCSLPHYRAPNTDRQRGTGTYDRSIEALRWLNEVGYGDGRSGLKLTLVTNPVGAFLPGPQKSLEAEWKRELLRLHGIRFDALFCLTNMPISRYLSWLVESENLESYMNHLVSSFNPATVQGLMCRSMVSVGWDGTLYDCDFNQMLELPVTPARARHVRDFDLPLLESRGIVTGHHCFGCTAGAGSSCGGATATGS